MKGKKGEDRKCLSSAEELASRTVIFVFLWDTKWTKTHAKHKLPRNSKISGSPGSFTYLALPTTCRNSWPRSQTQATAVTPATAVITPDPQPARGHQATPKILYFKPRCRKKYKPCICRMKPFFRQIRGPSSQCVPTQQKLFPWEFLL